MKNTPLFFKDARTFSNVPANRAYRPLIPLSLAVDYWLAKGLKPAYFQASTFVWFLIQLILMQALFRKICRIALPLSSNGHPVDQWLAWFATALYGLHPANAETVNYVIQRGDVYSTVGVVAGITTYALAPGLRRYGLYLLPVAAALLSKPPALIFPALLFVYILLFEEVKPVQALRQCLPALAVAAFFGILTARMTPASFTPSIVSGYAYRITQPMVALRYFRTFFLPTGLFADTDYSALSSIFDGYAWVGFLFVGTMVYAAWWCGRKREWRPAAFGLWWFLLALLPTALFPLAEVENDHRMYFPFVGLVLAVCWPAALWIYRQQPLTVPRKAAIVSFCFLVLAASALGVRARNRVWSTDESLFYDVTVKSPRNGRGLMNYGLTQMSQGKMNRALDYFERALPWTPNYPALEINLGIVNASLHPAAAEPHFLRAIQLAPQEAASQYFYARWLQQNGRSIEALEHLRVALAANPDHLLSRYLMMESSASLRDWPQVKTEALATLQLFPSDSMAMRYLAAANAPQLPPPGKSPRGLPESFPSILSSGELSALPRSSPRRAPIETAFTPRRTTILPPPMPRSDNGIRLLTQPAKPSTSSPTSSWPATISFGRKLRRKNSKGEPFCRRAILRPSPVTRPCVHPCRSMRDRARLRSALSHPVQSKSRRQNRPYSTSTGSQHTQVVLSKKCQTIPPACSQSHLMDTSARGRLHGTAGLLIESSHARNIIADVLQTIGFATFYLSDPSGDAANQEALFDLLIVDQSRALLLRDQYTTPDSPPIVLLRAPDQSEALVTDVDFDGILQLPLATGEMLLSLRAIMHAHQALARRTHAAFQELNMLRGVMESVTNGITIGDASSPDLPLIYVNPAFEKMTGYSPQEVLGRNCRFLQGPDSHQPGLVALRDAIRSHSANLTVIKNFRKDGTPFWNELYVSPLRDTHGRLTHFVGIQNDITERVKFEQRLTYVAGHDVLTGLVNRQAFLEALEQAIHRVSPQHPCIALIFIDLNNFKNVNDVFGHAAGDELLRLIGERMRAEVRVSDTVARFGGDEFVILIPGLADDREMHAVIQRLALCIQAPAEIRDHTLHPSASVGWSLYPRDARDPEGLLKAADFAMYTEKHNARSAASNLDISLLDVSR